MHDPDSQLAIRLATTLRNELHAGVSPAEIQAQRAFALYEANTDPGPVIAQTPAARLQREILRIAGWYGWWGEIYRALDAAGVSSLEGLAFGQLEQLQGRMARLEDCTQEGLDLPDAPPAR